MTGCLYGVGVGPGATDLITLRAHNLITKAKHIAYISTATGESLAYASVSSLIPACTQQHEIIMPMKEPQHIRESIYDQNAIDLEKHIKTGQDMVLLCEGDPCFYGSFIYFYERLSKKIPIEIIPGISSPMASAAALGLPLGTKNDILTILPAILDEETLTTKLRGTNTAAIIKLGRHFKKMKQILENLHLTNCSFYIENVTHPNEYAVPLNEAPEQAPYFSLIIMNKGATS
ncbi:MAG: precorrin-2 C(20)-methyltransferase [Pseudomonadota bacterium]